MFRATRDTDAGKVTFDICAKNGDARVRKPFCQNLQRDGFAGAGRPGDDAMTVSPIQQ